MEKLRFGLVGCGKVAELHARAIAASGASALVSVCGRDPQKREAFALRHGIKRTRIDRGNDRQRPG